MGESPFVCGIDKSEGVQKKGYVFRWGERMIVLNGFLTLCHLANTRGEVGEMCIVVVVEEVLVGFSLAHQYEVF